MKQFLFSSTVLNKRRYTLMEFKDEEDLIAKLNYLLYHRENATLWPIFNRQDIEELLQMDPKLGSTLRGAIVGSESCMIKYNSMTYEVYEITRSDMIKSYWNVVTPKGTLLLYPECIEFITNSAPNEKSLLNHKKV